MQHALDALQKCLLERRSTRAFTNTPVDHDTVKKLLALASRAPSGGNMQPWKVHVLSGALKDRLSHDLREAFFDRHHKAEDEYRYYPEPSLSPYADRVRETGQALYASLGIQRRDVAKRREQQARNYDFFGAPVGLIVTIDNRHEQGAWLDIGLFIGFLLVAAESMGLSSCVAASFMSYPRVVRRVLGIADGETIICGISIGYGDTAKPENQYSTSRIGVDEFAIFHDADKPDSGGDGV